MAGSKYERVLAAEWLVVMGTETLDALSGADTGTFSLPDPSRYFATMVVFLMLAAAAMFGERPGKLAAAFGGVAGLAILLSPGKNNQPPVIGALNYFDKLMSAGPAGSPSAPGEGNVPAGPLNTSVPATSTTPGFDVAPPVGQPSSLSQTLNKLGLVKG